ncbi:MAG: 2,3-bisphosphoglycerate-independent phosphoglycerate mutase, partial [Candidatus Thermoplasmatota archaeon]|nr:2,3-bisphosphoglycerate-independent phosphoglycerate mutase [Candidatus Thermoplasmatota archaeon]MBS3802686.1 2,3-bisphosphoglycerate-independent phosphoglycerate mutase [Candidatus Thermoplasmatota archaeon]
MDLSMIQSLVKENTTKIVLLVMDGVGGISNNKDNQTELEAAFTPHLDKLAEESICGLQLPVGNGITPGSGPGHLGIFGYNPLKYQVGRGVLAAGGINFELKDGDVAARGNFCTIDEQGKVTDRRAGRISTDLNQKLCKLLQEKINIPEVEVFVETVKEHRFLLVLRGKNLSGEILDTDPQETGKKPFSARTKNDEANPTAKIVDTFLNQAKQILQHEHPANMVLLRGFSQKPQWPSMKECFKLNSAAIAAYPMYRGVSKLIGMDVLETDETIESEFETLKNNWEKYDFFYVHIKKTDSYGEDGNFEAKKQVIEEVDRFIPMLRDLKPDVIMVTGDHSTPSKLAFHSWHPVPVMIWSEDCRADEVNLFNETSCVHGG